MDFRGTAAAAASLPGLRGPGERENGPRSGQRGSRGRLEAEGLAVLLLCHLLGSLPLLVLQGPGALACRGP